MKKIYILIISVLFAASGYTQILEKQANISLGVQPSLSTNVADIKDNDVEKLWKDYMDKYGKTKYNKKVKEYSTLGVRINEIKSGDPIDVYAVFDEFADGVKMDFCFDLGNGFVSKKTFPMEYDGAVNFVADFVLAIEKFKVEERLKDEEKALDKLNGKLKDAVKDNQKLHDKITDYEEKITQAEEDIKNNELEQEDLQSQIEAQTSKVKDVQNELNNIGK
ncbi:MAG: hypothetical protein R2771_01550 [Saprospiraceae bacterium]